MKISDEMSHYSEPFLQIIWDGNKPAELSNHEYQVAKGYDSNCRVKRVRPGGIVRIRHPFMDLVGQIVNISEGTIEIALELDTEAGEKRQIRVYYLLSTLYNNLARELTSNLSFGGDL